MSKSLFFISMALFVLNANRAYSDETIKNEFCLENEADFKTHKEKLPKFFQKLPLILSSEDITQATDSPKFAKLNLEFDRKELILTVDVEAQKASRHTSDVIQKICFTPENESGKIVYINSVERVFNYSKNSFVYDGVVLKKPAFMKALKQKLNSPGAHR